MELCCQPLSHLRTNKIEAVSKATKNNTNNNLQRRHEYVRRTFKKKKRTQANTFFPCLFANITSKVCFILFKPECARDGLSCRVHETCLCVVSFFIRSVMGGLLNRCELVPHKLQRKKKSLTFSPSPSIYLRYVRGVKTKHDDPRMHLGLLAEVLATYTFFRGVAPFRSLKEFNLTKVHLSAITFEMLCFSFSLLFLRAFVFSLPFIICSPYACTLHSFFFTGLCFLKKKI